MKHLRFLLMAALVAMPLTACDDDEGPGPDLTPVGTVSGTVSIEGSGIAGVSVTLVGATSQSATTDASGGYSFASVEAGSYGVAISDFPADVSFSSVSKTTSITTSGQTATVDFSGSYIRTASIFGEVEAGNTPLAGVPIVATGPEGASNGVTNSNGSYNLSGLRAGDYTVVMTPPAGYLFDLVSHDVTVGVGMAVEASFYGDTGVDDVSAQVVIESITNNAGVILNPNALAGQINITVGIDPGENDLQRVCVLLDGAEVDNGCQTLGSAVAEGEMEQVVLRPTFSIFTNDFDPVTGMPVYGNNTYDLSVVLDLENAAQSNVTTSMQLTFANADLFVGTVTPEVSAIGSNGFLYYGGSLGVSVVHVPFSGKTASSVTIGYYNGGLLQAYTDGTAPFDFTISDGTGGLLNGYQSAVVAGDYVWVTNAQYSDGTTATGFPFTTTGGANMTVDNVMPQASPFSLTDQVLDNTDWPVCCSNNWVNADYAFADALSTFPDNVNGVGGVVRTFHMGAATLSQSAIAALPAVATPGETGLAVSDVNTFYEPVAVLTDALGNQRRIALAAAGSNVLNTTVGLDIAAPTNQSVTGNADMTIWNIAGGPAAAALAFSAQEDRAGFSAEPVRFEVFRLAASSANTEYLVYGDDDDTGGFVNTAATVPACAGVDPTPLVPCVPNATLAAMDAYYTSRGHMMDQAGNEVATTIVRQSLVDLNAPVNQNINIPGSLVGGAMTTFTVPTADFDLWSGTFGFSFGLQTDPYIPFGDEVMLGDGVRWDGMLSPSATASITFPFVRGLEVANGAPGTAPSGTINAATWIQFISTDAAGNASAAQQNNFAAGTVPAPVSYTTGATATFAVTNTAINLCNGQGAACATGDVSSLALKAQATGPSGTYPNVFAGGTIYFYYSLDGGLTYTLLGTTPGSSGLISDTGATRTYEWSLTITSADVALIANGTALPIRAIGVNSTGDALFTIPNALVTVVDGS